MSDKLTNTLVGKPEKVDELSPNPNGYGFIKQVEVVSLPAENQRFDTLYITPDGRRFRWTHSHTWERVLSDGMPSFKAENKQVAPNTQKITESHEGFAQIFRGNVAVDGKLYVNGKLVTVGDDIPGDIDGIDSIEFSGVTFTNGASALTVKEEEWAKAKDTETYVIARFHLTSGGTLELPRVKLAAHEVIFAAKFGETYYVATLSDVSTLTGVIAEVKDSHAKVATIPTSVQSGDTLSDELYAEVLTADIIIYEGNGYSYYKLSGSFQDAYWSGTTPLPSYTNTTFGLLGISEEKEITFSEYDLGSHLGVKLYKHSIAFTDATTSISYEFNVITNISSPITLVSDVFLSKGNNLLSGAEPVEGTFDDLVSLLITPTEGTHSFSVAGFYAGTYSTLTLDTNDFEDFSDIVTEL